MTNDIIRTIDRRQDVVLVLLTMLYTLIEHALSTNNSARYIQTLL